MSARVARRTQVWSLLMGALAIAVACNDGSADTARGDAPTSMQDSIATANEVRASLEGEVSPASRCTRTAAFMRG
jgi:hypothetical protein